LGLRLNKIEVTEMVEEDILSKLDNAMQELEGTKKGIQNKKTAYAFIKALLDMGGSNILFFAICDKMIELCPDCSYPAYVVKVLKRYGIVFNSGSNRYPKWSLPRNAIDPIGRAIEEYR